MTFRGRSRRSRACLNANPIWRERTQGVGMISVEDCLVARRGGPTLRAAGGRHDIRTAVPYSSYAPVQVHVPVGQYSDVYDRYRVRMAEMFQSREIIKQCIENMPTGPINVDDRKIVRHPARSWTTAWRR